jgi:hypothetical protein
MLINTLGYYGTDLFTAVKKFYSAGPVKESAENKPSKVFVKIKVFFGGKKNIFSVKVSSFHVKLKFRP